jgi:hypothetical protein
VRYLCPREVELYASISNRERRKKWVCGRLLTKHLFLSRQQVGCATGANRWPPRVGRIDRLSLDEFPESSYRALEVTSTDRGRGGAPTLRCKRPTRPICLSLSHMTGLSGAYVDDSRHVGLDLETLSPRHPSFYRMSFSQSEHHWIELITRTAEVEDTVLYTLLWCLKESVLKSQSSDQLSLWRIPHIEVELRCAPADLVPALRTPGLEGPLFGCELGVRVCGRNQAGKAALGVFQGVVLTAVRLGEVKNEYQCIA